MRRRFALLLIFVLASAPAYARRRSTSHPAPFDIPELESIAAEALQAGVPGITIAVQKGNSTLVKS
ncbi:MAG TPA: hypothetical protein VM733_14490, partial [Thermoanaerobaculia bacterium]|nr:hypothetical protein [Thermoanaerobaculia bacterium]